MSFGLKAVCKQCAREIKGTEDRGDRMCARCRIDLKQKRLYQENLKKDRDDTLS
ncbi:MAG: hypothetical protein H8E89_11225 [Candidatus Nitrosopelagicus sp.]|nr:hypothetical protein [Candidatus Nitrosopelagicus sp.]